MYKTLNILMLLLIIFFISSVYIYYSSNKNIKTIQENRINIDKILKNKISNLPILLNDTNNVIEFNDSFGSENKKEKKRSFWDLLKR